MRVKQLLFLLPAAAVTGVGAAFLAALVDGRDPSLVPSTLIDRPAPEFELPPLEPRRGFAHGDLGGEVALVNVFASWCAPCLEEHPVLMRLQAEGRPVYGINYKDDPEAATAWLNRWGDPFTGIGADATGRVAIDWGVYGVPETFIVDRDGRIRYRHVGAITPAIYDREIAPRLATLDE